MGDEHLQQAIVKMNTGGAGGSRVLIRWDGQNWADQHLSALAASWNRGPISKRWVFPFFPVFFEKTTGSSDSTKRRGHGLSMQQPLSPSGLRCMRSPAPKPADRWTFVGSPAGHRG